MTSRYRTTWTKGQGYRPYIVLREPWGFAVGDWVNITMFGSGDRPDLTQVLCAEAGKGKVTSPVINIPRTWFRAIMDKEEVTFEVSMNTPITDETGEEDHERVHQIDGTPDGRHIGEGWGMTAFEYDKWYKGNDGEYWHIVSGIEHVADYNVFAVRPSRILYMDEQEDSPSVRIALEMRSDEGIALIIGGTSIRAEDVLSDGEAEEIVNKAISANIGSAFNMMLGNFLGSGNKRDDE